MGDDFAEAATAVSPGRGDSEGAGKFANPKCASSPRGESIFLTWSPKIFIEASAWRTYSIPARPEAPTALDSKPDDFYWSFSCSLSALA